MNNPAKEWARASQAQKKALAKVGHTVKSFLALGNRMKDLAASQILDSGEIDIDVGRYGKIKMREKTLMVYKTTCPKCGEKLGVKFNKTYTPYLEDKCHQETKPLS